MRALTIAACALAAAASASADDLATVRQRLLDLLCYPSLSSNITALAAEAKTYAANLLPNATWPDIDYNDYNDRADWKTDAHIVRTNVLVQASSWPASPLYGDVAIFNASRRALLTWSQQDWQNSNWWWDIISLPQAYSCRYLMMGVAPQPARSDFPTDFERSKGLEIMFRATWWNASLGYEVTGANLAWMIQAQLARGALPFAENVTALQQGFVRLWQEAKVVPRSTDGNLAQGIQHDWGYFFHGPQLQIGSYGQDFSGDMLLMSEVAAGTQWAAPTSALDILCGYWANGQAVLSVGNAFEWTAVGRQVARVGLGAEYGVTLNTTRIRDAAQSCPGPYRTAVAAWADRIDNKPGTPPLLGSTHFWASDATVHRRPGWVAVVHTHSTRTRVPECGNSENLKGRYMGEGALSIYGTACGNGANGGPLGCGQEYANIFPLFDWTLIPGTLAPADVKVPNCTSQCCWTGQVTSRSFVGGSTDGTVAVAEMDTAIYSISARRSWFMFDSAVVALAAAVSDSSGSHHLRTSLAQQWLVQPTVSVGFANGSISSLPDGAYILPDAAWVHAESTGWVPLPDVTAQGSAAVPVLNTGMRTGNWDSIGPVEQAASGRTIQLSIDHGTDVSSSGGGGGGWGYMVVPNVTSDAMPGIVAARAGLAVISNTATVQAVADVTNRAIAAVIWPPQGCPSNSSQPSGYCPGAGFTWTSAASGFSLSLNSSAPALVTYREDMTSGTVVVSVSNPDTPAKTEGGSGLVVTITVSRLLQAGAQCVASAGPAPGTSILSFALPGDPLSTMGQPQVQTCALVTAVAAA